MRGFSTTALLLAPVLAGAATPEVASVNIRLQGAQDVDLPAFRLDVFPSEDVCGFANIAIQDTLLSEEGRGSLTLEDGIPAVGYWKTTCEGDEQQLVVTLDSIEEQFVAGMEFTIRFRRTAPVQILDISGPAVLEPVPAPSETDVNESTEDDDSAEEDEEFTREGLEASLEEDREDLEQLRFMIHHLQHKIHFKEMLLNTMSEASEDDGDDKKPECEGFFCFLKGVFDRITGLGHPGRRGPCGNHTHGNFSRGNHSFPHPPWWKHAHGNHTHGNHTHGNHTFPHPPWKRPHHRIPFFCRPHHHRPHHPGKKPPPGHEKPPHGRPPHDGPPHDGPPHHGPPHGGPPPWARPGGGPPPWARPGGGPPPWARPDGVPPPWARPDGGPPPWAGHRGGPMHGPFGHGQPAEGQTAQKSHHHHHGPPTLVKLAILSVLFTGLFAFMRRRCRARRAAGGLSCAERRNARRLACQAHRAAMRRRFVAFVARIRGTEVRHDYGREEEEGLIEKSHMLMEEGVIEVAPEEKAFLSEKEEVHEDNMTMSQELASFRDAATLVGEMVTVEEQRK